jgi:hypothetical protein
MPRQPLQPPTAESLAFPKVPRNEPCDNLSGKVELWQGSRENVRLLPLGIAGFLTPQQPHAGYVALF